MKLSIAALALVAGTAAAGSIRGSDTLTSLLQQSSSSSVQDLVKQFQEIKAQAKQGVTPEVKTGLDKLIALVDDSVLPAINEASEADKAQVAETTSKVEICDESHVRSSFVTSIQGLQKDRADLKADFDAAVSQVAQCKATLSSLEGQRNTANANRQAHCCTYTQNFVNHHQIPFEAPVVECDFKTETKESCSAKVAANVADVKTYIETQKKKHDSEKTTCETDKVTEENLKGMVASKIQDVVAQENRIDDMDGKIDGFNNELQDIVSTSNKHYMDCRDNAENVHNTLWDPCDGESDAACGLPKRIDDRKKEWQAVGELKCIFTTYSAGSGASEFDEAAQAACVDKINTDHLSIPQTPYPARKPLNNDVPIHVEPPSKHTLTPENKEQGCTVDTIDEYALVTKPACPSWCPSGQVSYN